MSVRDRIVVYGSVTLLVIQTLLLVFGGYDAARNADQALILDASSRESGFVSRIRYQVHFLFGADPDRSGEEYWGESALEAATRRHNQSALDALIPRVNNETFRNALIKACASGNEVGAALLVSGRYPEDDSQIDSVCNGVPNVERPERDEVQR